MNHRPQNLALRACGTGGLPVKRSCERGLTVSQAIEGFILHKNPAFGGAGAQGLSQRTVSSYKDILKHWAARIGSETQVPSITSQDLKRYLVWKTTEYVPIRKNGKTHPLSLKTARNIYVTFQAFFRWVEEEFEFPSMMKGIPAPKFTSPPVEPFTKDDVIAMIKGCQYKRESRPPDPGTVSACHHSRTGKVIFNSA
jgi:integrase/recombinase XerD